MLKFAPDANGKMWHIDDVKTGEECLCHCPSCGAPLVAKNSGSVIDHHFAHKGGNECSHAGETALHMLAKEFLEENKQIFLPLYHNEGTQAVYTFERVELEQQFAGTRVADAVGYIGERALFIEFRVTHEVDDNKIDDIKSFGLSCVEVDLRSFIGKDYSKEDIHKALISKEFVKWIYAPVLEDKIRTDAEIRDKAEFIARQKEKRYH